MSCEFLPQPIGLVHQSLLPAGLAVSLMCGPGMNGVRATAALAEWWVCGPTPDLLAAPLGLSPSRERPQGAGQPGAAVDMPHMRSVTSRRGGAGRAGVISFGAGKPPA